MKGKRWGEEGGGGTSYHKGQVEVDSRGVGGNDEKFPPYAILPSTKLPMKSDWGPT